MIRRLLAVWRGRDDVVAGRARYPGFLLPHLLRAARRPTDLETVGTGQHQCRYCDPGTLCDCTNGLCCGPDDPTVLLPAVLHPGTGAGAAVDVRDTADRQPTAAPSTSDRPQVTMEREHEGADDTEFPALLAGMRHDLEHDSRSLDPAERERERIEREWEEAFARLEELLDLQARRSERRLNTRLDVFAPGWADAICGRHDCPRCATSFDEAMQMAGVIALPAEPVDWATDQWPVLEVTG